MFGHACVTKNEMEGLNDKGFFFVEGGSLFAKRRNNNNIVTLLQYVMCGVVRCGMMCVRGTAEHIK
jgi:hypothetical protein